MLASKAFNLYMHKRKRPGQRFTTTSSEPQPSSTPDSITTSQSYTYSRNARTGRLGGRQDVVELEITSEDMEVLQTHAEYCLPSESLLDFETLIQTDIVDEPITTDNEEDLSAAPSVSVLLCLVILDVLMLTCRPRPTKNGFRSGRTTSKSYYGMKAVRPSMQHALHVVPRMISTSSAWTASAQQCFANTASWKHTNFYRCIVSR